MVAVEVFLSPTVQVETVAAGAERKPTTAVRIAEVKAHSNTDLTVVAHKLMVVLTIKVPEVAVQEKLAKALLEPVLMVVTAVMVFSLLLMVQPLTMQAVAADQA